jgi:V-type H+-transporting ATPase subunit d
MQPILEFEADRRTINITLNSIGTELSKDDRFRLYPRFGKLYPEGQVMLGARRLAGAGAHRRRRAYAVYKRIFANAANDARKTLEDSFFEHEVYLNKDSFNTQFGFAPFSIPTSS